MNKRTAKLLKQYAHSIDRTETEVKKWWETLSWTERTKWRNKIEAGLNDKGDNSETLVEAEEVNEQA